MNHLYLVSITGSLDWVPEHNKSLTEQFVFKKMIWMLKTFPISGLSCVVLSVLVLTVSSALLAKRYKQGKTYEIEIEKEMWVGKYHFYLGEKLSTFLTTNSSLFLSNKIG